MARINQRIESRERLDAAIWSHRMVKDAGVVVSASLLMAISAHVSVPLFFSPVPFTLQPLAMLLIALLLGANRASAAMVVYLVEGIMGLPVFSPAGPGGIAQLAGPTGGFLMATPFAAFLAGYVARKSSVAYLTLAAFAAELVLFTFGASWFAFTMHYTIAQTTSLAVLPFLPGEVLKVAIAVSAASLWRRRKA